MAIDVHGFLAARRAEGGELQEKWTELEDLYNRKLWHQLTVALTEFVNQPAAAQGDLLVQLYSNFILDFESRLNQLSLVRICLKIATQYPTSAESIEFLESVANKVKTNQSAVLLCKLNIAQFKLADNDLENCKKILEESHETIEKNDGIELAIQGTCFKVSAAYNKVKGSFTGFYKDALRYLGCIDVADLTPEERLRYSFDLGLAALLSDEIYNFGELIAHPILETLKGTENEWLLQLIYCFNAGDMAGYEDLQPQWQNQSDLVANVFKLRQKMCLMALIEIVFRRPVDSRVIPFDDIATHTRLPKDEVEFLVMRAISLKLIRGTIDEITQTVRVTWVQPRVLDRQQIGNMAQKLRDWCNNVENTILVAQSYNTDDILRKEE